MKLIDYEDWERRHFDAFPQTAEWLSGRRDVAATRSAWQKALSDVDLSDCRQATEAFLRGEEEPPKSPQDWPRFVRRVAIRLAGERRRERDSRRHFFDGEETFACAICFDIGLVTVWHSKSVLAALKSNLRTPKHPEGTVPCYSAVARCGCQAGDKRRSLGVAQYDPRRMPAWCGHDHAQNLRNLEVFLEGLSASAF